MREVLKHTEESITEELSMAGTFPHAASSLEWL